MVLEAAIRGDGVMKLTTEGNKTETMNWVDFDN